MPQVPDFNIGGAPPIPNAAAPVASDAGSRFFDQVVDTANQYTSEFETQRGEKEGAASDGTPKTGFDALTSYGKAYNKSAGVIYSVNKQNEIDTNINQAYQDNKDNPAALRDALEKVKSSTLSNVPPTLYPQMLAKFGEKATTASIAAQTNLDSNIHEQAKETVLNQISANSRIMAEKKAVLGPVAATNDPDYIRAQGDNAALYQTGSDTGHVGGSLFKPTEMNTLVNFGKNQVREAEIKYQYSQTPPDGRDAFIENLALHGDKDLPPVNVVQLERQLSIARAREKANASQDSSLWQTRVDGYKLLLSNSDASVTGKNNLDIHDLLLQGKALGVKDAVLLKEYRALTNAQNEGRAYERLNGVAIDEQQASVLKADAALKSNVPQNTDYKSLVATLESSNDPTSANKYGFTDTTFADMMKRHPELRGSTKNDEPVMDAFTAENRSALQSSLGRDPTNLELYTAHFLGANGAAKFLKADPNSPAIQAATPAAIESNPSIFTPGATVKDVEDSFAKRIANSGQDASAVTGSGIDPEERLGQYRVLAAMQRHVDQDAKLLTVDGGYSLFRKYFPDKYEQLDPTEQNLSPQDRESRLSDLKTAVQTQYKVIPPAIPKQMLDYYDTQYKRQADAEGQSGVINQVMKDFPQSYSAILDSMKISGAEQLAGSAYANGDANSAETLLLSHKTFEKNKDLMSKDVKEDDVKGQFSSTYQPAFFSGDINLRTAAQDAYVKSYYYARARGDSDPDRTAKNVIDATGKSVVVNGNPYFLPKPADEKAIDATISNIANNPVANSLSIANRTNPTSTATVSEVQQGIKAGEYRLVRYDGAFALVANNGDTVMTETPGAKKQPLIINYDGSVRKYPVTGPPQPNQAWNGPTVTPSDQPKQFTSSSPADEFNASQTVTTSRPPNADEQAANAFNQVAQQKLPVDNFAGSLTRLTPVRDKLVGISQVIKGGDLSHDFVTYLSKFPEFAGLQENEGVIRKLWADPNQRNRMNSNGVHLSPLAALYDLNKEHAPTEQTPAYVPVQGF